MNKLFDQIVTEDSIQALEKLVQSKDKPEYEGLSITELGQCLFDLREKLDEVDFVKKELQKMYDHLSITVIPEKLDEEGVETVKLKGIGRLQTKADINCSVPANNREEVKEWLREHGHSPMISETINSSSFKAFVKEQMKAGKPYPEELIKISAYSRASIVKA